MYERVVFPTDGSEGARTATEHAVTLAQQFDAPLYAFSVADTTIDATDAFDSNVALEELAAIGEVSLDGVRERAEAAGVPVETAVLEGQPAETIVEEARKGDVLVLGTHGRTGLDRYLIGSTTETVVRMAEVPVVAVPVSEDEGSGD